MVVARLRRADRDVIRRLQSRFEDLLTALIPSECSSLLDVGCGRASPLARVLPTIENSVGVDALTSELNERGAAVSGHRRYVQSDVRRLGELFPERSFDVVVALDVLEHLEKDEGWSLLDAMERLATRRVIVFTPNGFLPQDEYDGNPYQIHLSGWTVDEFRGRGYRVMGVNGWRPLRGERASIAWRPRSLWGRVSLYTQSYFEERPRHAFQLLCSKELDVLSYG